MSLTEVEIIWRSVGLTLFVLLMIYVIFNRPGKP